MTPEQGRIWNALRDDWQVARAVLMAANLSNNTKMMAVLQSMAQFGVEYWQCGARHLYRLPQYA